MEQSRNTGLPKASRERLTAELTVAGCVETTLPSGSCIFFAFTLSIKPFTNDTAFHRVSHTLGAEDLPEELLSVLIEAMYNELAAGGRFGFPIEPLSMSIASVNYREGQSTEVAVRLAASAAFVKFLQQASLIVISK